MQNYLFTSESVTEGHPDKMCDQISDAILDAYIEKDSNARVACEVTATAGIISVMGEITSKVNIDINNIVRNTIADIGYKGEKYGFDADTCMVSIAINRQSEDISMGVSNSLEYKNLIRNNNINKNHHETIGAGDQGMMFGMACNETENLMPASIYYAHELCKRLSYVRKSNLIEYLGPDGKAMVTFNYENGKPEKICNIVISTQHLPNISQDKLRNDIREKVINAVIPYELRNAYVEILINPTGRFVKGGPCADTGLTGRKIIVDTYGGMGRHGGGAFSGKDPTKVDRSAAYMTRYIAKNIVAADIAEKCEIQISYVIGVSNPVSVMVDTFGTGKYQDKLIANAVDNIFDLRPSAIIEKLDLKKPIYKQLASYGHMGREDLNVSWEKTDKVDELKEYFNK